MIELSINKKMKRKIFALFLCLFFITFPYISVFSQKSIYFNIENLQLKSEKQHSLLVFQIWKKTFQDEYGIQHLLI